MLFNSFDFLIFFTLFFVCFFATKGVWRHLILFVASCVFYAWFIPKYLLILFAAIAIDYSAALVIDRSREERARKISLIAAITSTLGLLFIFKYHNFFVDNINWLGGSFARWDLILPIGLSFHTFQSLSYVIDVYWKKVRAEKNLLIYANYVMMFPQLVAGPIERAGHLLPQIRDSFFSKVDADNFRVGMTLFLYGLFKKMVVADNIGPYVSAVYDNYTHHTGTTLLVATMLFAVQIYADFSGYSDMAIGIARTLGFRFNDNFNTPYFARSVTEFWRRWHISLSSWLRDYLYYPLARSFGRVTKWKLHLSTLITFALIGLWHGANWTFIIFGTIHGCYLVWESVTEKYRERIHAYIGLTKVPRLHHFLQMIIVFILVSLSFIFFRATTLTQALAILKKIFSPLSLHDLAVLDTNGFTILSLGVLLLFLAEYSIFTRFTVDELYSKKRGVLITSSIIVLCIVLIFSFAWWGGPSFIYFQF